LLMKIEVPFLSNPVTTLFIDPLPFLPAVF
jgi:hypothetical protein